MIALKEFISRYMLFDLEEWAVLEQGLTSVSYQKGEMIHFSHDPWDALYFLHSGLVRSYLVSGSGRASTRQLHFNNHNATILNLFVVDYESMSRQQPGTIGFEVLEACELTRIDLDLITDLRNASAKWEKLSRLLLEAAYIESSTFYQSIIARPAKENYRYLRDNMPHLMDLVPQYHLASYIGITAVSFSRIKQEIESKNRD